MNNHTAYDFISEFNRYLYLKEDEETRYY